MENRRNQRLLISRTWQPKKRMCWCRGPNLRLKAQWVTEQGQSWTILSTDNGQSKNACSGGSMYRDTVYTWNYERTKFTIKNGHSPSFRILNKVFHRLRGREIMQCMSFLLLPSFCSICTSDRLDPRSGHFCVFSSPFLSPHANHLQKHSCRHTQSCALPIS